MPENLQTVLYLIAAVLFILSLGSLAKQETARRGNILDIDGEQLGRLPACWVIHPRAINFKI